MAGGKKQSRSRSGLDRAGWERLVAECYHDVFSCGCPSPNRGGERLSRVRDPEST